MTVDMSGSIKKYPINGADWTEKHWHALLEELISEGVLTWREVTSSMLGSINPSQVGTSIASKKSFQSHFEPRKCWAAVRSWHFLQNGRCADCGTRVDLQADHAIPREFVGSVGTALRNTNPEFETRDSADVISEIEKALRSLIDGYKYTGIENELVTALSVDLYRALMAGAKEFGDFANVADRLDNMVLRCRRHNVVRRPSHANGGVTFLTAEAGLMWLLFVHRPDTYEKFAQLCRDYGLTMANIRFEEAWAMARWLNQVGLYHIDPGSRYSF